MNIRIKPPIRISYPDDDGKGIVRIDATTLDSYSGRTTRAGSIGIIIKDKTAQVVWLVGEELNVVSRLLESALAFLSSHAELLQVDGTPPGADGAILTAALEANAFWVRRSDDGYVSAHRKVPQWDQLEPREVCSIEAEIATIIEEGIDTEASS